MRHKGLGGGSFRDDGNRRHAANSAFTSSPPLSYDFRIRHGQRFRQPSITDLTGAKCARLGSPACHTICTTGARVAVLWNFQRGGNWTFDISLRQTYSPSYREYLKRELHPTGIETINNHPLCGRSGSNIRKTSRALQTSSNADESLSDCRPMRSHQRNAASDSAARDMSQTSLCAREGACDARWQRGRVPQTSRQSRGMKAFPDTQMHPSSLLCFDVTGPGSLPVSF